jgi:hypothetical protein
LTSVRAFKCLTAGSISPFSRFRWPTPSDGIEADWVEAAGDVSMCRNGVHAFRPEVLSSWLGEELWEVELEGVEVELEGVLVARRGRLEQRVESWNGDAARDFALWCAGRAHELVDGRENERARRMATALQGMARQENLDVEIVAFGAAEVAGVLDSGGAPAERRRQSEWLLDRLGVVGSTRAAS